MQRRCTCKTGRITSFYLSLIMTFGVLLAFPVTLMAADITSVTGIEGVPLLVNAGDSLDLSAAKVIPEEATNREIVWHIEDDGDTGATVEGVTLFTESEGTVTLTATIVDGTAEGTDYTEDFSITVEPVSDPFVAVTDITGVPALGTEGVTLTLSGEVEPENATNNTIIWSIEDTGKTGAALDGNELEMQSAGIVTLVATIRNGEADGKDYVKKFRLPVKNGDAEPELTASEDTWRGRGSAAFTIDKESSDFLFLLLDDIEVSSGSYQVRAGSTIIELSEEYLQTLSEGDHEFRAEFTDGYAALPLKVEENRDSGFDGYDEYTATLYLYDGVQITYELHYPNNHNTTGPADVPIGGIDGMFSQIYCADPFVPFHGRVDSSYWSNGATVDTKGEYTVAAPWNVSAVMKYNADAIRWLVLNGYRGDYRADDQASKDSVSRLDGLYGGAVGAIDKTIALMATKVAIWKVLAGDDVRVISTSLDDANDMTRRNTFDALVGTLTDDALNHRDKGISLDDITNFTVELVGNIAMETDENITREGYAYFGPFTVTGQLSNTDGVDVPSVDKVFLTVSGPETDGVEFVENLSETAGALEKADIYGTDIETWYVEGGTEDGEWVSDEFYLKIPETRGGDGIESVQDLLTIKAMAMAVKVDLVTGTPVIFINGSGGIQDWNNIQAFIGSANDGMVSNLYAEDTLYTENTPLGDLWISKKVSAATPLDNTQEFTFRVLYSDTENDGSPDVLNLTHYPVHPSSSADLNDNTFKLRNGGLAQIIGLPQNMYYWVEEVSPIDGGFTPAYSIPIAEVSIDDETQGETAGPFQMDNDMAFVSFDNTKGTDRAHLMVAKYAIEYENDVPEYTDGIPFRFKLEGRNTESDPWGAVDLAGRFYINNSQEGAVVSGEQGVFTLNSGYAAYIEIEPGRQYRIMELETGGTEYAPVYVREYYQYSPDEGTVLMGQLYSFHDTEWTKEKQAGEPYATEGFRAEAGDLYSFGIMNIKDADFHNLQLHKKVEGSAANADRQKLFGFQIIYTGSTDIFYEAGPISLSAAEAPDAMLVEIEDENGNPVGAADRIGTDKNGQPTVLRIKHGETATIYGLLEGKYKIAELDSNGFEAAYSVSTVQGSNARVGQNGETNEFTVQDGTKVEFTNTKIPDKPSNPGDGGGDDDDPPGGGRNNNDDPPGGGGDNNDEPPKDNGGEPPKDSGGDDDGGEPPVDDTDGNDGDGGGDIEDGGNDDEVNEGGTEFNGAVMFNLSVSKIVTGDAGDDDRQKLFRFQLVSMDAANSVYGLGPVALSAELTDGAVQVVGDGIDASRIVPDDQGRPTVLLLKHNETAVIQGLYEGLYQMVELDSAGYATVYSVGTEPETAVSDTGATRELYFSDDTLVVFKNNIVPVSDTTADKTVPQTGDGSGSGLWLTILLVSVPGAALTLKWRKKQRDNGSW